MPCGISSSGPLGVLTAGLRLCRACAYCMCIGPPRSRGEGVPELLSVLGGEMGGLGRMSRSGVGGLEHPRCAGWLADWRRWGGVKEEQAMDLSPSL